MSLSGLRWLQAVLKGEVNVFCGRTLIVTLSYRTSVNDLAPAVTSGSWEGDDIFSFVGSARITLIW